MKIDNLSYYYLCLMKCNELHFSLYNIIESLSMYFPNIYNDWENISQILNNFILIRPTWQCKSQDINNVYPEMFKSVSLLDVTRQSFYYFKTLLQLKNIENNLSGLVVYKDEKSYNNIDLECFRLILNLYLSFYLIFDELNYYKIILSDLYKNKKEEYIVEKTPSQLSVFNVQIPYNNIIFNKHVLYDETKNYYMNLQCLSLIKFIQSKPTLIFKKYEYVVINDNDDFIYKHKDNVLGVINLKECVFEDNKTFISVNKKILNDFIVLSI